jgi:hypothetical protein
MRSTLWYYLFFYSVQGSQQSHCDTACVQFPNNRLQMDSHYLRQPYPEEYSQSRPHLSQAPMLDEAKAKWPSITDPCFIEHPISMALPQQALGLFHPEYNILQIHQNGHLGRVFRRPGYFSGSGFDHWESIPVICWLGNMPRSYPSSWLDSSERPHTSEAKVVPTCQPCSIWLDSDREAVTSPGSLGPTKVTPFDSPQAPPDWSFQKSLHTIPQWQFKCRYPGCNRQFRRRKALERHLTCHSDERPHVCWVPECHRSFKRSDNLKAHYMTHVKMGGRNRYVTTLDNMSSVYSPEFRGQLTLEGWPTHE